MPELKQWEPGDPVPMDVAVKFLTPRVRGSVELGARFLDETRPLWYTEINAETLKMSDTNYCVLGQTTGWTTGSHELWDWLEARGRENDYEGIVNAHGFDSLHEEEFRQFFDSYRVDKLVNSFGRIVFETVQNVEYEILGVVWVEAMKERYERFGGDPVTL